MHVWACAHTFAVFFQRTCPNPDARSCSDSSPLGAKGVHTGWWREPWSSAGCVGCLVTQTWCPLMPVLQLQCPGSQRTGPGTAVGPYHVAVLPAWPPGACACLHPTPRFTGVPVGPARPGEETEPSEARALKYRAHIPEVNVKLGRSQPPAPRSRPQGGSNGRALRQMKAQDTPFL